VTARSRLAGPLAAGLILLVAGGAPAHPHVYVVYSVMLPLGPQGVEHVGFVFTFDVLFSAILLRDAGEGDPESISRNHARMLQQTGGQVTYRFVVPLSSILRPPGTIDISVDDPGLIAAFMLRSPDPVDVQAASGATARCDRVRMPTGAPGPVRCEYAGAKP
jgi:ABC-type uncharacterized transport system substrate-binding protein